MFNSANVFFPCTVHDLSGLHLIHTIFLADFHKKFQLLVVELMINAFNFFFKKKLNKHDRK